MNINKAAEGYLLDFLSRGYSKATARNYKINLRNLSDYLGNPEINAIKLADLKRFMLYLRSEYVPKRPNGDKSPLSNSAVDNYWKCIRSFFAWAHRELDVPRPDLDLEQPQYQLPEIVPFSEADVKAIIKGCLSVVGENGYRARRPTANRDVALVLLLLDTGLRVGEVTRLNTCDVDLETGAVIVAPYGTGRKTKPRTVYLGKSAKRALWKYLASREGYDGEDPLFATDTDRRMLKSEMQHLLKNVGKYAAVAKVHPHRFRHTFATEFLRNGGDIVTLQRLLGHSTLTMVLHYLHYVQSDLAEAHRKASPADRWKL